MARRLPTLEEVRGWPATVDVVTAGRPFGLGRNGAYEAVKQGRFPVPVIKIGSRYRVVTAEVLALLEASTAAAGSEVA